MTFNTSSLYSFIMTIGLHAMVLVILLYHWDSADTDLLPDFDDRNYIVVDMMSSNPYRAEHSAKKKAVSEPKQDIKTKPVVTPKKQSVAEIDDKEKTEKSAVDKNVNEQVLKEKERETMERSLAHEVMEEQEYRQAVTDDEKAMAYISLIRRQIVQNWSRPPSARNGMEALLRVFLVPTGELVEVIVEESSGNEAFDRSALLAVEKAEPFEVPNDSGQFESRFRQFTVLFKPEDLRL